MSDYDNSYLKYSTRFSQIFSSSQYLTIVGLYPKNGTSGTRVSLFVRSFPIKFFPIERILNNPKKKKVVEETEGEEDDVKEGEGYLGSELQLFAKFSNLDEIRIPLSSNKRTLFRRKDVKIFSEFPDADYIISVDIPEIEKSDNITFFFVQYPSTKKEIKSNSSPMFQYLNMEEYSERKDIEDGILDNPSFLSFFSETIRIEEFSSFTIPEMRSRLKERDLSILSKIQSLAIARKVYSRKSRKVLSQLTEYCDSFRVRWRDLYVLNPKKSEEDYEKEKRIVKDLRKILNVFVYLFPGDNQTFLTRGCPFYDFEKSKIIRELIMFFEFVLNKVKTEKDDEVLHRRYQACESNFFKIFTDWNKNEFYSRDIINTNLIPLLIQNLRSTTTSKQEEEEEEEIEKSTKIIWILTQFCMEEYGSRRIRIEFLLKNGYIPILISFLVNWKNPDNIQFATLSLKYLLIEEILRKDEDLYHKKYFTFEMMKEKRYFEMIYKVILSLIKEHHHKMNLLTKLYVFQIIQKLAIVEDMKQEYFLECTELWKSISNCLDEFYDDNNNNKMKKRKEDDEDDDFKKIITKELFSTYIQIVESFYEIEKSINIIHFDENIIKELIRISSLQENNEKIEFSVLKLLLLCIERDKDVMNHKNRNPILYSVVKNIIPLIMNSKYKDTMKIFFVNRKITVLKTVNILNYNISTSKKKKKDDDEGILKFLYSDIFKYLLEKEDRMEIMKTSYMISDSILFLRKEIECNDTIDSVRSKFFCLVIKEFLENFTKIFCEKVVVDKKKLKLLQVEYSKIPIRIGMSKEEAEIEKGGGVIDDEENNIFIPFVFTKEESSDEEEEKQKEEEEENEGEEVEEEEEEEENKKEKDDFFDILCSIFQIS